MGTIVGVTAMGVILVVLVVGLSLLTINKGYAYKHTIDQNPEEIEKQSKEKE